MDGTILLADGSTVDQLAEEMLTWLMGQQIAENCEFDDHIRLITLRVVPDEQILLVKKYLIESGLVQNSSWTIGGCWKIVR